MLPEYRTYCRPDKWQNICATFQRYFENQTWFKLDPDDQQPSYQLMEEPEINHQFVCCDGKVMSPIIMVSIKKNCGDHEHEGLLYITTNNCLGGPAEHQGKLCLQLTWYDDDDDSPEEEPWIADPVLTAIWEADDII